MKRNKLVSIAAITVALGVLATGCAGGSGSSKSDSKSSGGTKTVTVKAGTGANVKPYTYVGEDNETTGYEMNFVKNVATRVIFLENGKIIEDGPPKEVFNHPKSDRVREFFAKINRMVEPEYSI